MELTTIIGSAAGVFTTSSIIPQIFRTIKLRKTEDISLWMYVSLSTGIFLWIIFGIMIKEPPIIIFNAISLILSLTIIGFKLRYG